MIPVSDYPELNWKQIQQILQSKGFEELKTGDKWYVHLQKDKKNVRIIKVNKVPRLFLRHIVDETDVPIEYFMEQTKNT